MEEEKNTFHFDRIMVYLTIFKNVEALMKILVSKPIRKIILLTWYNIMPKSKKEETSPHGWLSFLSH